MDEFRAYKSPPVTENEALEFLNTAERYISMKDKRWKLLDVFESNPVLRHPIKPSRYRLTTGDKWGCFPVWTTYEWAKESGGKVRKRLDELASSSEKTLENHARLMLDILSGNAKPLTTNPGFKKNTDKWDIDTGEKGKADWSGNIGHNDDGVISASGLEKFSCEQKVAISKGKKLYTCLGFIKVTGVPETEGKAELVLTAVSKEGKEYSKSPWRGLKGWHKAEITPKIGEWIPIAITVNVFEILTDEETESLIVSLNLTGFESDCRVYIDDLGLYAHEQ